MNTKAEPEFIKELNALIAKEAARKQMETLQETDWTVERMMEEHKLTQDQSRAVLDKLAKAGHFVKVRISNGSQTGGTAKIAYRPVEKKKA